MPAPSIDLFALQIGKQTRFDTGVVPTKLLQGVRDFTATPIRNSEVYRYVDGTLQPSADGELTLLGGEASLQMAGSFQMLPYLLNALFSAAEPTGEDPYTYTYNPPIDEAPTPDPLSIVYADANNQYRFIGALVNSITFSVGGPGEPLEVSADMIGYGYDSQSKVALTAIDIDLIMGHMFDLYIDPLGTYGATRIQTDHLGFELELTANRAAWYSLKGLDPADWRDTKWEASLTLTLALGSEGRVYMDAVRDLTSSSDPIQKSIRLVAAPSANREFRIDFAGQVESAPEPVQDADGVASYELTFIPVKDTVGLANWAQLTVTNQVSDIWA